MDTNTIALRRLQTLIAEALVISDQQGLFRESISLDVARVALNERLGIKDDSDEELLKLISNG